MVGEDEFLNHLGTKLVPHLDGADLSQDPEKKVTAEEPEMKSNKQAPCWDWLREPFPILTMFTSEGQLSPFPASVMRKQHRTEKPFSPRAATDKMALLESYRQNGAPG